MPTREVKQALGNVRRQLVGLHLELAAEKTRQDDLEREHKPAGLSLKSRAEIAAYANERRYALAFGAGAVVYRQPFADAWARADKASRGRNRGAA